MVVMLTGTVFVDGARLTALKHDEPYKANYQGAVQFMIKNELKGNIFNEFNYGGYLIWWLGSGSRFSIDGRTLNLDAFDTYIQVMHTPERLVNKSIPVYAWVMKLLDTQYVIISGCDEVSGAPIKLALSLIKDTKWSLVYADEYALIFMREELENRKFINEHRRPDSDAYVNILKMAYAAAKRGHGSILPDWKKSLAIGYEGMGDLYRAYYWINEYLKQMPSEHDALMIKKRIEGNI
jgi:hypothetical protein